MPQIYCDLGYCVNNVTETSCKLKTIYVTNGVCQSYSLRKPKVQEKKEGELEKTVNVIELRGEPTDMPPLTIDRFSQPPQLSDD